MVPKLKIRPGQIWVDKKTGDRCLICQRHHDIIWNVVFPQRSYKNHKMPEFVLRRFYFPAN